MAEQKRDRFDTHAAHRESRSWLIPPWICSFQLKSGADYNMAHDYDKAKQRQAVVHFQEGGDPHGRPRGHARGTCA